MPAASDGFHDAAAAHELGFSAIKAMSKVPMARYELHFGELMFVHGSNNTMVSGAAVV